MAHPRASSPTSSNAGLRVVDLGADYRLSDPADYERWYGFTHPAPELLAKAVYGLPEQHRAELLALQDADVAIVGSPGCYPTTALLGLYPLARAGLIADVVVDAKSGVSGAGRAPRAEFVYTEVNESVRAYSLTGHRHISELLQELTAAGSDARGQPGRRDGRLPAPPGADAARHPRRRPCPAHAGDQRCRPARPL